MAQNKSRELSSAELRDAVRRFRARLTALEQQEAGCFDWRRLQFDVLRAFVDAQRSFVGVHARLLANLRADMQPHEGKRQESLALLSLVDDLYDLMRSIERKVIVAAHVGNARTTQATRTSGSG